MPCASTRSRITTYALDTLVERFGDRITIHGPPDPEARGGVLSFAFADLHPHDVAQVLDQRGRVRAGRPPLRQAPDAGTRRAGHRPRLVLRVQRRPTTSTLWPMGCERAADFFAL